MCGFTVIKYKDAKKIDDNLKTKLLYSQSHRGPDYEKLIEKNNIFFFHNRLKIIDLSNNSNQPFVSKKTGNIIVFNGEIYNYKALKKYCGTRKFYSNSDTEILLYLYEKKGKEFIKLLNGIFSFVIYDKNKNLLISGRDRVGVKPLYTYEDKTKIIYSTEIKPILIIQKNKINFDEIKKYISSGKLHENKFTFFNNIFLLKPSCINIFNLKSFKSKTTSYWKLKKDNSLICKNYEEFYKKFIKLMKQSLNLNLVGDVKVGLLYSSGTDSNFLRSFLLKENKKNLKCFTFGWREKKYNEIERLKEIGIKTNKKGIKIINQSKIIKKLEKIIYMCEGPIGGFGIAGMYDLFKLIKKQKIKVVLSGEGSDEFSKKIIKILEQLKNF
jgi:asparagine synthase (glutamine-hydrolysing)